MIFHGAIEAACLNIVPKGLKCGIGPNISLNKKSQAIDCRNCSCGIPPPMDGGSDAEPDHHD